MDEPRLRNFLTEIIDADVARGLNGGEVVTRFPPEPNGFLHIGHAKSICVNFGLAAQYGGRCHLRFDDTNPVKEDVRYVEAIQADIRWLGFDWGDHLHFGSDAFGRMAEVAEHLIARGLAYVDESSVEAIREGRGAFDRVGTDSPFRQRTVAENQARFAQMRAGALPDGAAVLRAKIDMAHPNMIMRDPLLYRIRHTDHHRTGDAWCIYPMYDFAHCLEDAFEGITHSICTLEFESNRELYDWVLDAVHDIYQWQPRPRQYEFARLNLAYTVMSKRKFLRLVEEGHVEGWDDPRMPTIAGMRRRGVTAASIRAFAEMVGVAKNNSFVDIGKLEHCVRADLEAQCPRALGVLEPVSLTLDGLAAGYRANLSLPWWPGEPERAGARDVPISAQLLVERDDYQSPAPKGWKRMTLGGHVRLFGAFVVRIDAAEHDDDGVLTGLRGTALLDTLDGSAPADGSAVAGAVHWVDADASVEAEVRLYDRLVRVEMPEAGGADFLEALNPDSLRMRPNSRLEAALAHSRAGERVQLLRLGYFCVDPAPRADGALRWNRIITLRDTWSRAQGTHSDDGRPNRQRQDAGLQPSADQAAVGRIAARAAAHAEDAPLQRRHAELVHAGLTADDADVVAESALLFDVWRAAAAVHAEPDVVGRWVRNDFKGALGERSVQDAGELGGRLGRLVALVANGALTAGAAKRVLVQLVATGREAAAIAEELGLGRSDDDVVASAVASVVAAHPDEAARYAAGEKKLKGFFIGQVMAALRGAADANAVRVALDVAFAGK